ncbi:hypothetical protein HZB94_00105 [Candidatus Falkowbacteria bacterium]|nr:hypothetical protein [Candidatus Falkowbacteria bacterium]
MNRSVLAIFVAVLFMAISCTEQGRAKNWGGKTTIDLAAGKKLEMITWKDEDLWILTRPMRPGEQPETWSFKENTSWGLAEGEVIIKEKGLE